tara:strand:- start:473 stop:721 length:249 start_codon:yes stop_codon:yes gene_type:complete
VELWYQYRIAASTLDVEATYVGKRVILQGLRGEHAEALSGREGRVARWNKKKKRYVVELDEDRAAGKQIYIKAEHLRLKDEV